MLIRTRHSACPIRCIAPFILALLFSDRATAAEAAERPQRRPLLSINSFRYEGAFRLPAKRYGPTSLNFSQGPIALNTDRQSLFIVGHRHHQAIAEFKIPVLVNSTVLAELNVADDPIQPFTTVLDRSPDGNPDGNNGIGGMVYISGPDGPELLVNTYQYYDAPADNTLSMLVMRDATKLAECQVDGYFEVAGRPGHTAGWISPIPAAWQAALGGPFLIGNSSGIPIISRASVGPSAFVFNPQDIVGKASVSTPIATTPLLDFSLAHPLHEDLRNESRENTLWNHLSRAVYGVILPGTRTYATFGHSGGNRSGIGYKNLRDDGSRSGGYSSYAVKDNYHYYWFWDLNDLLRVKAGVIAPHEVRPYEYGIFETPFAGPSSRLGGGALDASSGRLYLTALGADSMQGRYANPPVVMAYRFGLRCDPPE
jgi:hypothetical protein